MGGAGLRITGAPLGRLPRRRRERSSEKPGRSATRTARRPWPSLGQTARPEAGSTPAGLSLAQSIPGVPVQPGDLDRDLWAFNVQNGVIDLRTGQLRPHNRADLITKLSPVEFDPDATAPLWLATLKRFLPDADLGDWFWRLAGSFMAGVVRDHMLAIAYGDGHNGKSTIFNAVKDAMGPDFTVKLAQERS